ncbi:hypothetical protein K3495_g11717 [Podosphaera aphanis]|nr:hypothetical protein K3495_g11717 [Podosphaera aphanis]
MIDDLYHVTNIASDNDDAAYLDVVEEKDLEMKDNGALDDQEQLSLTEKNAYLLMHRRLNHLGPRKIRNLHKVTTLSKAIKVPTDLEICDVCATTKLTNIIPKELSAHESECLALVQFDIVGPFAPSLRGNKYLILIIDSWSRRNWIICLKQKSGAQDALMKWRLKVELEKGKQIKATRSDNAPELIQAIKNWNSGTRLELTAPASSYQNGASERNIGTAVSGMRAMLKEASLPLEFWDEAVEYDAYVRDRTDTGPVIEGSVVSPIEAWTEITPSIDHLVYSPDIGSSHRSSRVLVDETVKGGTIDLKLRGSSGTQEIPNILPDRKPLGSFESFIPLLPRIEMEPTTSTTCISPPCLTTKEKTKESTLSLKINTPENVSSTVETPSLPMPMESESTLLIQATDKEINGNPIPSQSTKSEITLKDKTIRKEVDNKPVAPQAVSLDAI